MATKYIPDADGHGWLTVKHSDGSLYPPLPQHMKVDFTERKNGRDEFKLLEGRMAGKTASVKAKSATTSYLITSSHQPAATVKFDIAKGEFWYGTNGPISATTQDTNPPPKGTFDLEIPYEAHSLGNGYLTQSKYATTWFRIGHSGDRFLHPGRISLGCVTITAVKDWTKIYNYLIQARQDGSSVGKLKVV